MNEFYRFHFLLSYKIYTHAGVLILEMVAKSRNKMSGALSQEKPMEEQFEAQSKGSRFKDYLQAA